MTAHYGLEQGGVSVGLGNYNTGERVIEGGAAGSLSITPVSERKCSTKPSVLPGRSQGLGAESERSTPGNPRRRSVTHEHASTQRKSWKYSSSD